MVAMAMSASSAGLKEGERDSRDSISCDDSSVEAFGKAVRRHDCRAFRADAAILPMRKRGYKKRALPPREDFPAILLSSVAEF
jgi:hypothetical protein